MRQHGYSFGTGWPDCVQVVIALIVTPQGFPLAYERDAGQHRREDDAVGLSFEDRASVRALGAGVDHGPRASPREETLSAMRGAATPVHYLVGTPKGRLTRLERRFLELPWRQVREAVDVKLLAEDGELYILAQSRARIAQGARHAQAAAEEALAAPARVAPYQAPRRDELLLRLHARRRRKPVAPIIWSTSVCPSLTRKSPPRRSSSTCDATSCAQCAAARAATCCART